MARKSPRQIRKIRSVGSILVGGWIRGTRTSFNEKFSVFVASRRRQPTKIIARSMVSPVSCKVHATRNRAAVSESSFPPPFPMHRLFANLLLSPLLIDADFRQPSHELFIESIGHRYFLLLGLFHVLRFFEIVGLR